VERLGGRGGRLWEVVIDVTGGVMSCCLCVLVLLYYIAKDESVFAIAMQDELLRELFSS
jgi:hypothetical protein